MRKRVFISGVTGTMGSSGLRHLLKYENELEIITLVRPSRTNKKLMQQFESRIKIFWGDLLNYDDVKNAISNVDYILHIAALVSPEADANPTLAYKINVGSIENILKAITELQLFNVKLVNIGSVAQTGDRLPPNHWGRCGDPLKPSYDDYYAVTKIKAERLVMESGLKYWVSLRQTGILHYGLLTMMEGIIFHQPLNNVLEWISEDDSGRLLAHLCIKDLPDDFYRNVYNIGGGESCRINNYDFMSKMMGVLGIENIEKIFEPNWFATSNFHGQYYLDSDLLNDYLDFRRESIDDFLVRLKANTHFSVKGFKYLPNFIIKNLLMKKICQSESGPLFWLKTNQKEKTKAFFQNNQTANMKLAWKDFKVIKDYSQVKLMNHGYDENKAHLDFNDMRFLANFRGGKLLSSIDDFEDLSSKLFWKCCFSHKFTLTPNSIIKGGHWCPQCEAPPWNFEEVSKKNPYFQQVYKKDEC